MTYLRKKLSPPKLIREIKVEMWMKVRNRTTLSLEGSYCVTQFVFINFPRHKMRVEDEGLAEEDVMQTSAPVLLCVAAACCVQTMDDFGNGILEKKERTTGSVAFRVLEQVKLS